MSESTLIGLLIFLAGGWSFLGSALGLPIFVNNRKFRGMASIFGVGAARLFYAVLGFAMICGGFAAMAGFVKLDRGHRRHPQPQSPPSVSAPR